MTALLIYILISYVCVQVSVWWVCLCVCVCGRVIISREGDHNKSGVRQCGRLRAKQVLKLSKMSDKFNENYA